MLNDFSVQLLTDVAAFAHTNPRSIGSQLQRAVAKPDGGNNASALLANGSRGDGPAANEAANDPESGGGEPQATSAAEAPGDGPVEGTRDETLTERFDEDDSVAARTW